MAKANTRLAGHGLRNEGRLYVEVWGYVSAVAGRATCECGAKSDVLPNAARRKSWHRAHKDEIRHGQPNLIRGGA